MVKDRARKQDARKRMESTGEPYSVARHSVTKSTVDSFGWTRVDCHYPNFSPLLEPDNGFPVGHKYSHHQSYDFAGGDSFDYGWYPTVGFFSFDRGVMKKELITSINDRLDIVGDHEYQPWVAFQMGMKNELAFKSPPPASFPNYVSYAVCTLVASNWNGDLDPVARLGYAFWLMQHNNGGKLYWMQMQFLINFIWMWFSEREMLTPELMTLWINRKNEPEFRTEGITSLSQNWASLSDAERLEFVTGFASFITSKVPDLYDVDESDIIYNQYSTRRPVKPVAMEIGDEVKVRGIGKRQLVRAKSDNFVVLTHIDNQGEARYSVIDWKQGVIGAHNSFGYGILTNDDAQHAIEALESKKIEVSYRNRIPLEVQKVSKG